MSAIVIDTNVLLVASGRARQMSDFCLMACCRRLQKARSEEQVVVDNQFLILGEYQKNLDANKRPPSPGSEFVRHLLQHMGSAAKVARIDLTPTNPERTKFAEFPPEAALESAFDPADRKFVAAAYAHPERPHIVEAADSKWLDWEVALKAHGIKLEMPCRAELRVIRDKKLSK